MTEIEEEQFLAQHRRSVDRARDALEKAERRYSCAMAVVRKAERDRQSARHQVQP